MIFPADVPGWLSELEGRTLADLADGKVVLEIGSYKGRSTICMAQTARVVHALDWHKGDDGAGFGWTLPEFLEWVEKYGVFERVVTHLGRTEDVGPVLAAGVFDLAYVDGAHNYADVRTDLEVAARCVRGGGVIAIHDSHYEEVSSAASDVLGWQTGGTVIGSLRYEQHAKAAGCVGDAAA